MTSFFFFFFWFRSVQLPIFDEVALKEVLHRFPDYSRIHEEIHARVTDLPVADSLRDIRQVRVTKKKKKKTNFSDFFLIDFRVDSFECSDSRIRSSNAPQLRFSATQVCQV